MLCLIKKIKIKIIVQGMKNRMVDNCDIFYHFMQCLAYER